MSIAYIRNLPGREADRGLPNDSVLRRSWLVLTDTRYTSEALFLADCIAFGGIPIPYISTHPDDITHLCKRLRGRQDRKSPLHWTLEAEFDTKPSEEDEEENPLDRRAKFAWSTVKYQKAIEKSRNGNAILNSAGDYFDPPPLKDVSRWTVTVTKNLEFVPLEILTYADKLNSDEFVIDGVSVGINVARIMSISIGDIQQEGDVTYRVLSYTLEFDPENEWEGNYLNQGYYCLDTSSGPPYNRIRCKLGTPEKDCVSPQLLDDDGSLLANPDPSNATFEAYDIYDEMEFNGTLPLE